MQHIIEQWKVEKRAEFEKEFTYGVLLSASSDLTAGEDIRFKKDYHPETIQNWWLSQLPSLLTLLEEGVGKDEQFETFESRSWQDNDRLRESSNLRNEYKRCRNQERQRIRSLLSEVKQQFN